ncbi:MAG: hypothetical protein A2X61_11585 [Ignavibacteria bacterium GWB2_35_12]|nr:MAG: hypothetical protein A2X63_07985 [Ignavibacteria bacterium GWA2_35_8]OGU40236.1 MAG: hypothetical protein A2X61_11585 [Ignavibacteria bacterium GWB2_35_12]OGV23054.1 MAG: hypothetical protein A2475_15670 [Ignavibacteria bacterium RIFOXYC2_FULL_35_21]
MANSEKYKMTISLNILNHLGINLYSNIPAVLSEVVANSWDADAETVEITIDDKNNEITIYDNGEGMNEQDINDKYLTVGYQRRKIKERSYTPKYKRHVMGRKGIGKLALFAIADEIEIHSVKEGEKNAFLMETSEIKKIIESESEANTFNEHTRPYNPKEVDIKNVSITKGTKIFLRKLKKNLKRTPSFLRKRLSRRFSILGEKNNFVVIIDGESVSVKDRDYFKNVEFVWYFGSESLDYAKYCINSKSQEKLDNSYSFEVGKDDGSIEKIGFKVKGWIGTFDEQKQIDTEEENNTIVILSHGKLNHEDLMSEFKEGRIFSKYLIGEIEADFLDDDDLEDIITTNRQSIKENDFRWVKLKEFLEKNLKHIGNRWDTLRGNKSLEKALSNEAINEWYKRLQGDNKKYAEKLFAKIEKLKIHDPATKREIYKSSIMAFEKLALKDNLSLLENIETIDDVETIKRIFTSFDSLEETHYFYITKGRLEVIEKFKDLVNPKTKEKVLQQYIFKHLWLLDPSWERAAYDAHIEVTVNKLFKEIDAGLTEEESLGRLDIKYRTAAGKNIESVI